MKRLPIAEVSVVASLSSLCSVVGFVVALSAALLASAPYAYAERDDPVRPARAVNTAPELSAAVIDESIAALEQFFHRQLNAKGRFPHSYDWSTDTTNNKMHQVRQASGFRGLLQLDRVLPSNASRRASRAAIRFLLLHTPEGGKDTFFLTYPDIEFAHLGAHALVALGLLELKRVPEPAIFDLGLLNLSLRGLLRGLAALNYDGLWHEGYDLMRLGADGIDRPYFSGAALVALVQGAKYYDDLQLQPVIDQTAEFGHQRYIEIPLAEPKKWLTLWQYFPWAMNAYFEFATGERADAEQWRARQFAAADWMVDVRRVLAMPGNIGYVLEGLVYAGELARRTGDTERYNRYRAVVEQGLQRLIQWQFGGPFSGSDANRAPKLPPGSAALGGVPTLFDNPELRIDSAQHLLGALLVARRYWWQ